ncbi:hypothetical protein H4R21_005873 [Coemansia helicoidea]|uniref:Uncharacterized protein n=1 Tax=Coemansia helicoidea TaxID=1286919 RepID=A0ACC1KR81_9FUNG|nr:hypothetical protein H4R21_005873 [Coemansia helicoidea]
MIRHPPVATAVTQKDVDELAAMHHRLLARIQGARADAPPPGAGRGDRRAATPVDGFSVERARRQNRTTRERLGLA